MKRAQLFALFMLFVYLPVARSQAVDPSHNLTRDQQTVAQSDSPLSQPTSPIFVRPKNFVAGYEPDSIVSGDLRADGKSDLVVANPCVTVSSCSTGQVSVLLGNGDGTFQPAVSYASGGFGPDSVALADFNEDGKLDIVLANNCESLASCVNGSVSVLLGNGDGTFQPAVTYLSGGTEVYSVAVGDFDGDGKPDLVIANECAVVDNCSIGSVSVLRGNGDGTFQLAVNFSAGFEPLFVTVADLNGDGKPDLIVLNSSGPNGSVGVLIGNGDATFQPIVNYASGALNPLAVSIGDFNGDGKPDLAVANRCASNTNCSSGSLSVFIGNGDGTFQTPQVYATTGAPSPLAAADFNGDGNLDLVAGLTLLLGTGEGTFQTGQTLTSVASSPSSATVADFNGDGKPDLALAYICSTQKCGPTSVVSVYVNVAQNFRYQDTTTVTSSPNPSQVGQSVTLTASVVGAFNAGPITGSVSFDDGATLLGTVSISNGQATLATSSLTAGAHSITAVYGGDTNYLPSTSPALTQTANSTTSSTTTTVASSLNPSTYGQSVTLSGTVTSTASGTPTGSITFSDGSTTLGTSTLSEGTATLATSTLNASSHSITASYSGDSNFAPSASAPLMQTVNQAPSGLALSSSNQQSFYGQPITYTATIFPQYGGLATGNVTFTYDLGIPIGTSSVSANSAVITTSTLPIGTHQIAAEYFGDTNVGASVASLFQSVKELTTIGVTASANPITTGQSVTFTANVSSSIGPPPNGETVTFRNGSATLGMGALSGGAATFTTSALPAGSDSITATYSGDATFLVSKSAILTETVNKYATTATVASNANPSSYGQSVTFTATVSSSSGGTPTGTVTFRNGGAILGTQTLSGDVATFTTSALIAGTHSITATYNGDASNATTTSPPISQVVAK